MKVLLKNFFLVIVINSISTTFLSSFKNNDEEEIESVDEATQIASIDRENLVIEYLKLLIKGESCSDLKYEIADIKEAERLYVLYKNSGCDKGQLLLICCQDDTPNEFFRALIKNMECDINVRDDRGITPLIMTVQALNLEKAKILVELGANLDLKDISGKTALIQVIESEGEQELKLKFLKLLLEADADPNIKYESGWSALMFAIRYDNFQVIELLNQYGASLDDFYGENKGTALSLAKGLKGEMEDHMQHPNIDNIIKFLEKRLCEKQNFIILMSIIAGSAYDIYKKNL